MDPVVSADKMKKAMMRAITCKWHLAGRSHCHTALAWDRISVCFVPGYDESLPTVQIATKVQKKHDKIISYSLIHDNHNAVCVSVFIN